MEDSFDCSGMFKPALFYFGKDIHEGPPTETCIKHFKKLISQQSRIFATTSIFAGVVCLFLFLTHCGYYSRPRKGKEGRERPSDLSQ